MQFMYSKGTLSILCWLYSLYVTRQSSQRPLAFLDFVHLRLTQIIVYFKKAKLRLSYLEKDLYLRFQICSKWRNPFENNYEPELIWRFIRQHCWSNIYIFIYLYISWRILFCFYLNECATGQPLGAGWTAYFMLIV